MTCKPLVSIILTLYNIDPNYLKECLNSLINQTYDNIEILCIDDCSPIKYDDISKLSPKIRLIHNETNLGMHESVNKAFKLLKGKYAVRLGSDDKFDPTLIEKEVTYLEASPNLGAVCCQLQRFGDTEQLITRPKNWDYRTIVEKRLLAGTGYAGGMMFRVDLLDRILIDKAFKMCEDFDFHLQILRYAPIQSIHEILYYYRSHNKSLCRSIRRTERWEIIERILEKHRKWLASSNSNN